MKQILKRFMLLTLLILTSCHAERGPGDSGGGDLARFDGIHPSQLSVAETIVSEVAALSYLVFLNMDSSFKDLTKTRDHIFLPLGRIENTTNQKNQPLEFSKSDIQFYQKVFEAKTNPALFFSQPQKITFLFSQKEYDKDLSKINKLKENSNFKIEVLSSTSESPLSCFDNNNIKKDMTYHTKLKPENHAAKGICVDLRRLSSVLYVGYEISQLTPLFIHEVVHWSLDSANEEIPTHISQFLYENSFLSPSKSKGGKDPGLKYSAFLPNEVFYKLFGAHDSFHTMIKELRNEFSFPLRQRPLSQLSEVCDMLVENSIRVKSISEHLEGVTYDQAFSTYFYEEIAFFDRYQWDITYNEVLGLTLWPYSLVKKRFQDMYDFKVSRECRKEFVDNNFMLLLRFKLLYEKTENINEKLEPIDNELQRAKRFYRKKSL